MRNAAEEVSISLIARRLLLIGLSYPYVTLVIVKVKISRQAAALHNRLVLNAIIVILSVFTGFSRAFSA